MKPNKETQITIESSAENLAEAESETSSLNANDLSIADVSESGSIAVKKKRKFGAVMDLTKGSPLKVILAFAIPLLIGNVFQQFYAMADTIIVGQTISAAALTGVGCTNGMSFLILGFAQGLTSGFAVITSQRKGANDIDGVRRSIAVSILFTFLLNAALTVIAVFTAAPLLDLMRTKEEFYDFAFDYIIVIFYGLIFNAFYNQFANSLRAIGDNIAPLAFLILACFINIGLDFLFIITFKMGVAGAAWASNISNAAAALATYVYMYVRYKELRLHLSDFKLTKNFSLAHLKVGIPMAIQFSIISIGIIMNQTALNSISNPVCVTSYTAACKIDNFAIAIILSLGTAFATFVGQNYGAGNTDRIKSGLNRLFIAMIVVCAALGVLLILLSTPLTSLFITKADQSDELFDFAKLYMIYNSGFYIFLGILSVYRSALQGMSKGLAVVFAAAAEVAMRVVMALISIYAFAGDINGAFTIVCIANMAAWAGADLLLVPSYYLSMKKLKATTATNSASAA